MQLAIKEEPKNIQQTVDKVLDDIAAKRQKAMSRTNQTQDKGTDRPKKEFKEITLKFGKGCVGEEFQGKDGNAYKEILVPNPDKNDNRPWQTFVVKANHVHENQYGKGVWIKLPAEGHTTLRRSVVIGEKPDGKKEWGTEKTSVSNADLKKMVEAYKERPKESVRGRLTEKKAEVLGQKPAEQAQNKNKSKGAEL